jgi:hypothetical protein
MGCVEFDDPQTFSKVWTSKPVWFKLLPDTDFTENLKLRLTHPLKDGNWGNTRSTRWAATSAVCYCLRVNNCLWLI